MKPDYQRIEALERSELGLDAPKVAVEMTGYVVLMDSLDREASDRQPVTFEVGYPHQVARGQMSMDVRIKDGPITLIPTRVGTVHAVAVFDDGSRMPACNPDWNHSVRPGDTFTITP